MWTSGCIVPLTRGAKVYAVSVKRCGSRKAQDFRRNDHRKRQVVTGVGVVDFWLPCVVCQCGGSVVIPFSILRPYQQIWVDLGLSLRQMQTKLGHQSQTHIGLRSLNQIINHHKSVPTIQLSSFLIGDVQQ